MLDSCQRCNNSHLQVSVSNVLVLGLCVFEYSHPPAFVPANDDDMTAVFKGGVQGGLLYFIDAV